MNVLVLNNMVPFLKGGAEALAAQLVRNLNETPGIQAELIRIPFKWEPAERLIEEILICRSLRMYGGDLVIGLKFPAYLIPHDRKRLWLLHQFRQAYDLWDLGQSNIPKTPRGHEIRQAVIEADNHCFPDCEKIFASRVVANRLQRYNGLDSEILMAPLNDPELFVGGDYGSYVFCGGRINAGKRQHLLVEAMRFTRSNAKLVVAGPAEAPADAARLQALVEQYDLNDRVQLELGFLSRERIAKYVNEALACAYLPIDEDSVGYVTMEAFASAKAMLTVSDSGGLLELVRHGDTGLVVQPDPESLAAAIDQLANNRDTTVKMGKAGACTLGRHERHVACDDRKALGMKIAWVTPYNSRSGIGHWSRMVAGALSDADHAVTIVRSESRELLNGSDVLPGSEVIRWDEVCYVPDFWDPFDAVVYNIGDNYPFHAGAIELVQDFLELSFFTTTSCSTFSVLGALRAVTWPSATGYSMISTARAPHVAFTPWMVALTFGSMPPNTFL